MAEYIERKALLEKLNESFPILSNYKLPKSLRQIVNEIPAADVVEVAHGKWIISRRFEEILEMEVAKYTCSACKEYRLSTTGLSQATNYCPHCGARMDGADG